MVPNLQICSKLTWRTTAVSIIPDTPPRAPVAGRGASQHLPPQPLHKRLLRLQHRTPQRQVLFLKYRQSVLQPLLLVQAVATGDQAHSTRTPQHYTVRPRVRRTFVLTSLPFLLPSLLRVVGHLRLGGGDLRATRRLNL